MFCLLLVLVALFLVIGAIVLIPIISTLLILFGYLFAGLISLFFGLGIWLLPLVLIVFLVMSFLRR